MYVDAPTLEKYSQTNPRTFIFSTYFRLFSTSVIPSFGPFIFVRFRQLQPLGISGPPPTEAQRLTIQTFHHRTIYLIQESRVIERFVRQPCQNPNFRVGEIPNNSSRQIFGKNKTSYIFKTQNLDLCVLKKQNLDLCDLKTYILSFESPEQVCTRPQGLFIFFKIRPFIFLRHIILIFAS